MDTLIHSIEETAQYLLKSNMEKYAESTESMINEFMKKLPCIIMLYSQPEMEDISGDAEYWPKQLERIIGALEKGDDMYTADVLINETRENLIELSNEIHKRGISIE